MKLKKKKNGFFCAVYIHPHVNREMNNADYYCHIHRHQILQTFEFSMKNFIFIREKERNQFEYIHFKKVEIDENYPRLFELYFERRVSVLTKLEREKALMTAFSHFPNFLLLGAKETEYENSMDFFSIELLDTFYE
jgi:hypothetical protein